MRFLVFCLFATGCGAPSGPPFPELAPASGVVKKGDAPVKGGTVTFAADPPITEFLINSEVGADGKFSLTTVRTTDKSGERKSGVAAGKYTPTYYPPASDQITGGAPQPIALPPVTIPKEGNANLVLSLPARK